MFFEKRSQATYYVKSHAPEFRRKLKIVRCTIATVRGDTSDDTQPEDIEFAKKVGFTVVLA